MVAVESAVRKEVHRIDEGRQWMTADDLLTKFHGKHHLVDAITARAESRSHPDFPQLAEMKQYRVSGECKETFSSSSERTRAMHWTAMLTGQVALEMARNVESLFSLENSASVASPADADGQTPAPKAKARGKAKPKAKKVATPADVRKQYVDALAAQCMTYIGIMMEIRAKLGVEAWTAGLRQMLDGERSGFEDLHGKLVTLSRTEWTDAELAPLVNTFKERSTAANQYIVAGDNMTNKKSRKLPVEPVAPTSAAVAADAA
jgi:hypothetical protein